MLAAKIRIRSKKDQNRNPTTYKPWLAGSGKFVPRSIFVDLEPSVIDEVGNSNFFKYEKQLLRHSIIYNII